MNSEQFESSDLQSCVGSETDAQLTNKCGHLEIALLYDAPMRKMTVHVLQARDIPSRDRGQPTHTQVANNSSERMYCNWTQSHNLQL